VSLSTLLEAWQTESRIAQNIVAHQTIAARPAQVVPFAVDMHPALVKALQGLGIAALYTHQATAWESVRTGEHPIVVTGTASGKTLCYNLPILDRTLRDPEARALYLFPTKALAQDQLAALKRLVAQLPAPSSPPTDERREKKPGVATYDGDTLSRARRAIRKSANLVLSNPDMLHMSILPHHTTWAEFFAHLAFVVIDEAHTYRGVFGSHVANVLRRLKRVARFYGSSPQFVLTSATIGNPVELGERLIEEPVTLVDNDGAPRGDKHFLIYNPPVIDPALGLRRSMLLETVGLAERLLRQDVQTIVFGRARHTVEIILSYLQGLPSRPPRRENAALPRPGEETQIRAYRSGYLPSQRREIERGLRDGSVRAVVATTALELGIDIGGMGAALLAGYPGTIAGTWQQAGRAGRKVETSLAAMIASPSPLDQFLAHHPDYFFGRSPEQALVNPDNLLILLSHLRCAAFELPFDEGEPFGRVDGDRVAEFLRLLQASGVLHRSGNRYFWMSEQYPARDISLRSTSPEPVVLQTRRDATNEEPAIIGQVDQGSARWMVHPGAVYLHEGQQYLVEELDLEAHIAWLRPVELDYYTQPRSEKSVQLVERLAQAEVTGATKSHGEIRVTEQVIGFRKVKWFTHEQLGMGDLELPPSELQTMGYWLSPTEQTVALLREQGLWSSDPNDYGPDWEAQRDAARARDAYRCQRCGVPERDRQHDVHHRIPFRAFESYQEANQLSNLVTLCPRCHRRAETSVRLRSGLSGLAFVLGHLAPLFLMCDARDVGVHADPRSPLADAQPAIVVYDGVPAGIGFSKRLYELHEQLMDRAYELVAVCPCLDGCPSCVGPGGESGMGGKAETLALLGQLTSVN
jgi:DEAD/DEAH box helicase domain-containing protein